MRFRSSSTWNRNEPPSDDLSGLQKVGVVSSLGTRCVRSGPVETQGWFTEELQLKGMYPLETESNGRSTVVEALDVRVCDDDELLRPGRVAGDAVVVCSCAA